MTNLSPAEKLNYLDPGVIQSAIDRIGFDIDENGCHIWRGPVSTQGYGRLYVDHARFQAQRAAWVAKNGPMPITDDACHKCDVRSCINPDHVFPGDRQQNMKDASSKGRVHAFSSPQTMPRGERHGSAKLKTSDAFYISISGEPNYELARRFGVNKTTVSRIKAGKLWRIPIEEFARASAIRALKSGGANG